MTNRLYEMANMVGKYVKTDEINFSFYFSGKTACKHSISAKIKWNREKLNGADGTMQLFGNYKYSPSAKNEVKVSDDMLEEARIFFKKYKVLFSGVWELAIEPTLIQDYLRKLITFPELMKQIVCDNSDVWGAVIIERIGKCNTLKSFEDTVVEYSLFKVYD